MMKRAFVATAAALTGAAMAAGPAQAAGLDRSGQSLAALFADDDTATVQLGIVNPQVTGEDLAGGGEYSESVGERQLRPELSFTGRISDTMNYAVIIDHPYGADVNYGASPLTTALGGTGADLNSVGLTFAGRYALNDNFSVFGAVTIQRLDATVALNGTAYRNALSTASVTSNFNATLPPGAPALDPSLLGAALQGSAAAAGAIDGTYGAGTTGTLGTQVTTVAAPAFVAGNGYNLDLEKTVAPSFAIGAAYEIPSIAFRLAGTYRFETEHTADVTETVFGATFDGSIDFVTPASFNLEFQTGIAPGTLLTATYRWTDFEAIELIPPQLNRDLVERETGQRFTLGIGRQITDGFAASATLLYEPELESDIVSPLDPVTSLYGLSLGGRFTEGPLTVSGGINYSQLGDARPEVGGQPVATFEDNHSVSIGLQVSMAF